MSTNGYWIIEHGTNVTRCSVHGWTWESDDTESECRDCAYEDYLIDKAENLHEWQDD